MSLGGVPLLDLLRPPEGYRTTAALLTSYSADLIACLAALVAMDGDSAEEVKYGKLQALRALERLRNRVRIVAHQGRVSWHGQGDAKVLGLFDAIVRTVPFDGRSQSFHPKVVLARQESLGARDRFVLAVGSRNLTSTAAWDLGLGLVGYERASPPTGTRRLDSLSDFVGAVVRLIAEPELAGRFGRLAEVCWELPEGVDKLEFRFRAGEPGGFAECELASLPANGRALLLSPFLTPRMVTILARHLAKADEVRLVSGRGHLDKVAASAARRAFTNCGGRFTPFSMLLATEDAAPPTPDDTDPEQSDDRGLHAKVFAVTADGRTTALVGSANLTHHAWLGENWEAFLFLRGSSELGDALWEWSGERARPYRPPEPNEVEPEQPDPIEELRAAFGELAIEMYDTEGRASTVICSEVGPLLSRSGCRLEVARFTRPAEWARWQAGEDQVTLPPCEPGERTSFLLVRATCGGFSATWVQSVHVEPAIDDRRDQQAFVAALGVTGFLRYLQGMLDDLAPIDDMPAPDNRRGRGSSRSGWQSASLFCLEDLLRRLAKDPHALDELDETVTRYRTLFERAPMQSGEREELRRFLDAWKAISAGMRMP
jgi:hypothetical protein